MNPPTAAATEVQGLARRVPNAFPAMCHLLIRDPENGVAALTTNVGASGDIATIRSHV